MDPVTHCLVGGMAAKTAGTSNRRFWIMVFLGSAPDLDVIFNNLGSWAFWLQHRGITHSIVGIVAQAFFYSWIFCKWDKGPFKERTLLYLMPLALHTICDLLTSHGVPLLSPFMFREYSFNLMVGLGVVPILFMSVGLLSMHMHGTSGWRPARPMWAGWILYFMVAVTGKAYAYKLVEMPRTQMTTVPSIANPFVWSAVQFDESSRIYRKYRINLLQGMKKTTQSFPMPGENFPIQASMSGAKVQTFLKDARWPVVRVSPFGQGWVVEWGNILFSTRGIARGKIRVIVDANGTILSEKKIFNFWNPSSV